MTLPAQTFRLSTCHRHPSKPITGFCAACLTERLTCIDPATHQEITTAASELRRSKSCSGSKFKGSAGIPEPRRNSCDVRAQNTLQDLLHVERSGAGKKLELEIGNLGYELKEEDEAEEEVRVPEVLSAAEAEVIVSRAEEYDEGFEMKTMKELIDLEWQSKKNAGRDYKDIAGSFWEVTSVFSNKFRKWRGKQKLKKESRGGGEDLMAMEVGKSIQRRNRETQLEVRDYGLGRRSCDTDPRMPLDACHYGLGRRSCDADPRMSLDACDYVRFSFDEPRVSWDGSVTDRAYPRLAPLISVVEEVSDAEKMKSVNEEQKSPGGSAQTRDYYTLQRRRRSFDRKAAGLEVEELKSKVTPETIGLFHGAKLLVTEKELMESNWNQSNGGSHSSESSRSTCNDIAGQKGLKKVRGWHKVWHVWGSIQKQRQGEDKYLLGNVTDGPLAESLQKLRRVANGEGNGTVSEKLIRSYSVSSRNSQSNMAGLGHNMSIVETEDNVSKRREEPVLQRNRSAPYSPTNLDNGSLQFQITPLRSSRGKSGRSRLKTSHTVSRNVL